ncbi:MAG: phosphatidylserine decarboxylase family protein [Deltaproteobacteria bacterium]|nr:phosphatidylserine decarboxylase family protein [Deltaproteobacteria bacterium]
MADNKETGNSEKYEWADPPASTPFPIAKDGYSYIAAAAFITLVLALLHLPFLAFLSLLTTVAVCLFFRDPDRLIPTDPGALVAAADGRIIFAGLVDENPFLPGQVLKISTFMSVANVHVNRFPVTATVEKVVYTPGDYMVASHPKASLENEHNAVYLKDENGKRLCVVQVAGLIARRIRSNVKPGDRLLRGQRFGLICFGSRVDLYLPPETRPTVNVGDVVRGGTSILAKI